MNTEKLVSIILPTYNGASRIRGTIMSVISQSYTNWELLVIDDGSADNTKEVVDHFSKNDLRIKYIKNQTNLGIQKTLNKGLKEAKGEYIARIDDDDLWIDTEKLKRQVVFLTEDSRYVLVGTGFVAVDESGREIFKRSQPQTDKEIRSTILNKNCFTHSSVLFKKDTALRCGGYSESMEVRHIEDYELWLKLGTTGMVANLPTCSVRLVLRVEGLSSQNKILQFKKSISLIKNYKEKYPNYTRALVGLTFRMSVYYLFQLWPFRFLYTRFYKFYKNI